MPSFSKDLDEALHRALVLASERQHEFATVEHLLLALIDDPDAANEMRAREINLGSLRHDLVSFIDSELTGMVAGRHVEARPTAAFQRVVQRAILRVQTSGRTVVSGEDVLNALLGERESYAAAFLQAAGPAEQNTEGPTHEILHPANWARARGYANGVAASGRMVFLGGQVGWNAAQEFETDDFAGQVRQALENIVTVLAEAGAQPHHLVRLTWFVTDREEYLRSLKEVGAAYRDVIGRHYPAMTLAEVRALAEPRAKVEIEATAVVPG